MDRNDRNILLLGILILILLILIYYFLLLSPLRAEYLAAYEEQTQKEERKAQLERTAAALENIQRNAPDVERQILELSKRIPEQDEIPTLIVQIEEVARQAEVTQLRIEPGEPEAPPGGGDFSRIPITMSFEGTYEQLQDFLLRVRNLSRLVTVNEVNYEPVEKAVSGGTTIGGTTIGGTTIGGTTSSGISGGRTTMRSSVENLLTVEISAEVYVQPAAGEGTSPAGGGATASAGGGEPKSGGAPKGGGKAKGDGAAK